ncbi:unnamed protein product [Menidia menidia]|uniref:(Atlantic silverside) hypothetical protein n=1 Tax=Menidia menidia TaxID=238744 RepID=A0A8S4ATS9_9TELE|nr:unnamed protein product [Menidia menidia]
MDSGFCVRVLLLSLSFGQLTKAYGGRNVKLYPKAETHPHSYKPASNYETSAPPRVSLAGSRLPQTGLSQSAKSSTQASFQGQSDHGRQVDGYSQPRSVSSYRPASLWSNTRQASHQPVKGVYQGQDRAWETVSPRSNFGSGTVSSGAIEMHSGPLASQQSGSSNVLKGKAGMWDSPTSQSGAVPRSNSYSTHGATSYVPLQPRKPHPKPVLGLLWTIVAYLASL